MKKTSWFIIAAILGISTVLSACGAKESAPKAEGSASSAPEVLNIGEIDPLTGSAAVYGSPQHDAIALAVDEINKGGGVKVGNKSYTLKVTSYDDKGDANEAISAVRKLIDRDGVKYIVGWASSGSTMGAAKMMGSEDALMLVGTAGEQSITTQGYKNVIRNRPPGGYTGGPAGKYVADHNIKKIAVVGQLKDALYQQYYEQFKKSFTEKGGTIAAEESFSLGDRDMYTQLTKVIGLKPDALFVPGYVEQGAFVFRQARELGYKGPIYSFTGGSEEQFLKVATNEQMEGIVDLRPDETTVGALGENGTKYVENYKTKFGKFPAPNAIYAYDQMYVLKNGLEKAGSLEVDKVTAAIKGMEPPKEAALKYIAIDGKMFDGNGQAYTTNVAMQWKSGKWAFVEELPADAKSYSDFLTTLTKQKK